MAGQADFEESNIALLGSDLEKEVRLKAAQTVEAYKGAGEAPGIEVWRIEKFEVVPWPKEQYGSFFNGDSFICLRTYKEEESEKLLYDIHFWLGENASQDEMGVAAYMTVVLDDLLGTLPVQYREVEGHESHKFMNLWGDKGMKIMDGGVDSGFNHVEPTEYQPRLLHVKGTAKCTRVRQVALGCSSLNTGDVFILDNGLEIIEWHGPEAGVFEKRKAAAVVDGLQEERMGRPKTCILDGLEDHESFWATIGGEQSEIGSKEDGGPDEQKAEHENKLYKLSDASGDLTMDEAGSGDLAKDMFDSADVFIADIGHQLFCWVGSDASRNERRKGMKYATDFLVKNDRPLYTPIVKVVEGGEPSDFKAMFGF